MAAHFFLRKAGRVDPLNDAQAGRVDPLNDARDEIEQIDVSLKTHTQALAEPGYNVEQIGAEITADNARKKPLGLTFASTKSVVGLNDSVNEHHSK